MQSFDRVRPRIFLDDLVVVIVVYVDAVVFVLKNLICFCCHLFCVHSFALFLSFCDSALQCNSLCDCSQYTLLCLFFFHSHAQILSDSTLLTSHQITAHQSNALLLYVCFMCSTILSLSASLSHSPLASALM